MALADGARLREELRAIAELAQQHEEARRLLRLLLSLHIFWFTACTVGLCLKWSL